MTGIDYSAIMNEALLDVVRRVLDDVAKNGLRGENHFYITAVTHHIGVMLPHHLRAKHPDTITIVLQHQYSDLRVSEDGFGVTLTFQGKPERLYFPFRSLVHFRDPSEPLFALQFEVVTNDPDDNEPFQKSANNEQKADVISLDAFRKNPEDN